MITERLRSLLEEAIRVLRSSGVIPGEAEVAIDLERPARPEHGDFSSNVALALARRAEIEPRELAEKLVGALPPLDVVSKVEVAGPGFINFHLSHSWLYETIVDIATQREAYGRSEVGKGIRVQVEYGSANPTGPLHVGNARNIAYGDALAGLLARAGYSVERENYLNDAGGQVERFARSLEARYLQALGREAELPEGGYEGDYLIEMGRELADTEGMGLIGKLDAIRDWGLQKMTESQRKTLERFGVAHDHWVSQRWLLEAGKIEAAIERLREAGHIYEEEGAVWFRATDFGHTQDRVVIRSQERGGEPTYLAADTAYLLDKLGRSFDRVIYFWGADHHGTAENLMAVARALGVESRVEILIYQFVNFTGGRVLSKRAGELVTLDELIDEVGVDAARFTFLLRSPDSSMDFDFDFVKSQSLENPVYYVQYAHARVCSLLRFARDRSLELRPVEEVVLSELVHETERELIRRLAEFPEMIEVAAKLRAPYRLTNYARSVAEQWHIFYENRRVVGDDPQVTQARLWLAEATRQVLANTLLTLGVSAPERM